MTAYDRWLRSVDDSTRAKEAVRQALRARQTADWQPESRYIEVLSNRNADGRQTLIVNWWGWDGKFGAKVWQAQTHYHARLADYVTPKTVLLYAAGVNP